VRFKIEKVVGGPEVPWSIVWAPDGRMIFTERPGRVRVFEKGALNPKPLFVVPDIEKSGESGLMSVALHPQFSSNHFLYLSYAYSTGGVRVRVATMPAGEDPDTLVRKGGVAELEKVLKDAVDVLERKIQLLERRGWFEGIEHRRDALDRLLPTLRATADPIMRELYLTLVSERTGVSREVLEKEAKAPPAAAPEAPPEPSGEAASRRQGHSPGPAASRRLPPGTSAERTLITLFLADDSWLDRARREVPISWFERPALREIYAALLDGADASAMGDRLSQDGIAAWQKLRASAASIGLDPDRTYADATQKLEARPLFRDYSSLISQREQEPDPARKAELVQQAIVLRTDLQKRFPDQWKQLAYTRTGDARARPRRPHAS